MGDAQTTRKRARPTGSRKTKAEEPVADGAARAEPSLAPSATEPPAPEVRRPAALPEYPFALDPFQLDAIAELEAGRSVVVCAPTGSGKTVVGEYALHAALAGGRRAFYTTPLKALSNQKFRDFGALFGPQRVGLLTGDISINGDAPLVVMTTEVFRNMLYAAGSEARLKDVRFVVLDECHYINDAGRGTVWEESVICSPREIQLVALSATIANSKQLAAWFDRAHGPTGLIVSEHRPVPLRFHYFEGGKLSPLLKKQGHQHEQPRLRPHQRTQVRPWEVQVDPEEVVAALAEQDMLPAIYFVFSRRGCEEAMQRCAHLALLTEEEVERVEQIVEPYLEENATVRYHPHLRFVRRGVAAHHAGLLPAWKVLVERLFQAGLIKAVFATETLAAGINMPARTTVISSLSKRTDEGYRSLTASEFLQMSGRAGRRGMDKLGHVVINADPFRPAAEAARLAMAPPDPLTSRFTPTYGMVLNLLHRFALEDCERLLKLSFGEFLARGGRAEERRVERPEGRKGDRKKRRRHGRDQAALETHSIYWGRFLALREVLQKVDYLEGDAPTLPGLTAAALRTENELLVAEALRLDAYDELTAADFAAVITALAVEEPRPNTVINAHVKGKARGALLRIRELARDLRRVQRRYRVDVPVRVIEPLAGLTQIWAGGATWEQMLAATDMDEGDIVHFLRRTLDLLRQIATAPHVPDTLRDLARAAFALIDREPVNEVF
jgi:superfamily II RNA helicase